MVVQAPPPWLIGTAVVVVVVLVVLVSLLAEPPTTAPLTVERLRSHLQFSSTKDLDTAVGVSVVVEGFAPRAAGKVRQLQLLARRTLLARADYHAPVERAVIPLPFVGGVFWIEFTLQGSSTPSRAVLDTGSSNLVVGTEGCASCDASLGLIREPPSHDVRRENVAIHYGSQSVLADLTLSSLRVRGMALNEDLTNRLLGGAASVADSLQRAHSDSGAISVVHTPTEVLATKRMTGATKAFVFGIAPSSAHARATHGKSLLETIFPSQQGRASFGILMGRRAGAWIVGPPPPSMGPSLAYVPIHRPPHLRNTATLFFMVELVDVLVGPSTSAVHSLFPTLQHRPQSMWVMFDTGSSDTYCSSALRGSMRGARRVIGARNLRVVLVLRNGVHLVLTPDTYIDDTWGTNSLDTEESYVDSLLGAEGMLVGAAAMRGWFVQHDLQRGRMGFASLTATQAP